MNFGGGLKPNYQLPKLPHADIQEVLGMTRKQERFCREYVTKRTGLARDACH